MTRSIFEGSELSHVFKTSDPHDKKDRRKPLQLFMSRVRTMMNKFERRAGVDRGRMLMPARGRNESTLMLTASNCKDSHGRTGLD